MNPEIDNIDAEGTPSRFPALVQEKLKNIPTNPGVYQYKNQAGTIIYIGKAKNLRSRVKSYFNGSRKDAKTTALVSKIADMEFFIVDSEAEALILESTLIKKHKPRYNIMLRDDKSYPYVRVTNEEFPRVFITRKIVRDGSKYFGPYTEVRILKSLMKAIRSMLFIRSCELKLTRQAIDAGKFRVCLDYHIKKCQGPCQNYVSQQEYKKNIDYALQFLSGKTQDFEKQLEADMYRYSEEMQFEQAALARNRLAMLRDFTNSQKIVTTDLIDRDVLGLCRIDSDACVMIFKIRDGKLIGKRHFVISNTFDESDGQIIQTAMEKWYMESDFVPKEICLPTEPAEPEFITEWLRAKRGRSLEIVIPKVGDKKKLVNLAGTNAEFQLREYHITLVKKEQTVSKAVSSLQRDLRLKKLPRRIECYDNSHIQGTDLVSSMVVFIDGKPKKSEYRKFKIRTVGGNDDFASMREVIERRFKRAVAENQQLPDLIIIDGGKGQLSSAHEIMEKLGVADKIVTIGLAKRLDEVFFVGESESLLLPRTSSSLRLIQHLRDEAHRFAITFHRSLRDKRTLQTELTEIPGVGKKKSETLLKSFGSVEMIKRASEESLAQSVGASTAKAIMEYFNKEKNTEGGNAPN